MRMFGLQIPSIVEVALVKGIADELAMTLRWNRFAKSTLQQERKFKPKLREVFKAQKAEVLKRIQNNPPPQKAPSDVYESWLWKPEEWAFVLENAARPFIEGAMIEGAADSIRDIEHALGVTVGLDLDVNNPRIAAIINDKLQKFSFEVDDETMKLLKAEFTEALKEGDSIPLIRKRVEKVFGFTSKVRTERIARTEIIGAHNAGNFEAMIESGVVETKKWIATRDSRTRDTHRAIDGQVVDVGKRFSNGLRFPGDWGGALSEFINCRCTMVVEDVNV